MQGAGILCGSRKDIAPALVESSLKSFVRGGNWNREGTSQNHTKGQLQNWLELLTVPFPAHPSFPQRSSKGILALYSPDTQTQMLCQLLTHWSPDSEDGSVFSFTWRNVLNTNRVQEHWTGAHRNCPRKLAGWWDGKGFLKNNNNKAKQLGTIGAFNNELWEIKGKMLPCKLENLRRLSESGDSLGRNQKEGVETYPRGLPRHWLEA